MYFDEQTTLYYDGQFLKVTQAHTDLYSQTLHYGYGVFEGIRSYLTDDGPRIFKAQEHYDRLIDSCRLMNIPLEYNTEELTRLTYELLEKNGFREAYIRPLVVCTPNMSLTQAADSKLVIAAWEWGGYLGEKLLNVTISSYCRPHPRSIKVDAKACGHYVNSILAVTEAKDAGYDEALLLDHQGFVAEGPGANFFFEKDGMLFTPEPGNILCGITRDTVLGLCDDLGIEVIQGRFLPEDLGNADSAFYCGTGAEIIGIASINDRTMPKPWSDSLGNALKEAYQQLVRKRYEQPSLVKTLNGSSEMRA